MDQNQVLERQKVEKFSYSKLSVYENCPWRYKLVYINNHFIADSSIATDFGTLVHYIEETIANDIKANNDEPNFLINTEKYSDMFMNINLQSEKETVLGVNFLKEKYPIDFYTPDKTGLTYEDKVKDYLENGIFSLRSFLIENPHIRVVDTEKEFSLDYNGYVFHGFIDRVLQDTATGKYIIEDIKTWSAIDEKILTTPLQFVIYCLAAEKLYNISAEDVSCFYATPFLHTRYAAGTKGFIKRGQAKISKLFSEIEEHIFKPKPSPLCHWCPFCPTNPNQKEEAKNLCPYFMKWTRENKDKTVAYEWMGIENHDAILADFIANYGKQKEKLTLAPIIEVSDFFSKRSFLLR